MLKSDPPCQSLKRENGLKVTWLAAIETKVVKFVCTTEHNDLASYFYSFQTLQLASEVNEHFKNIS